MSAFKFKRPERKISYLPELQRISSALRRLATAASRNHGSDCYIHSALAQVMLARLGIESKLVAGYAGWRLGNGDSDMVLHAPLLTGTMALKIRGVHYRKRSSRLPE